MKSHLWTAAVVVSLSITFPLNESKADGFTPSDFQKMFSLSRDASKKHAALLRQLFPRIIGGVNANPGEFPHQVSLMYSSKFDPSPGLDRHFCGGSIIADEWVMTAAHCVQGIIGSQKYYSVGSGNVDLNKLQEYELDGVWIHPSYDGENLDYDFALIKVRSPFFDREIALVTRDDNQLIDVGAVATLTGWGVDGTGNIQQILKKVDVKVVSRTDCNDANSYNGAVTSRMICLGLAAGGKDTCQGDSGGPALTRIHGTPVLFGSTSWGHGCALPQKYGVYGRLIAARSWIDSVTGGVVLRQRSPGPSN
jgi:trypsin